MSLGLFQNSGEEERDEEGGAGGRGGRASQKLDQMQAQVVKGLKAGM